MNFKFLLNIFLFRKKENIVIDFHKNSKRKRSDLKCYILAPPLLDPKYYIETKEIK
tara:strand:+ start:52 stop:219 length:168 start_codon:yes stop_codon:yes gene_type:complete